MEKKNKRCKKSSLGITLIALVITIIVLLILAGVSLNLIMGKDGILGRAEMAVEEHTKAQKEEELRLKELESLIVSKTTEPWNGDIATGFAGGNGTKNDPYIIKTGAELAYFAEQVNSGESYEGKYIEITEPINLNNQKITPIGLGTTVHRAEEDEWNMQNSFNGHLNGNGNIITGINIEELAVHGVGLIGSLERNGVVENVYVYSGTIKGKTCVAGIVGANRGTIKNCINKANIIAQDNNDVNSGQMAGGIVGWSENGTIEKCTNYGSVITRDDSLLVSRGKMAGGIVGYIAGHTEDDVTLIKDCINNGEIRCMYQQVGGIAGSAEYAIGKYSIENCTNNGKVVAEYHEFTTSSSLGSLAGGIIGWLAGGDGSVLNCTNNGEIIAENTQVGGIVGSQHTGIVSNCINNGKIIANKHIAGGILGIQKNGIVSMCTNNGEVIAESQQAGGVVGRQNGGTIKNVSNTGKVIAKSQGSRGIAGGILGVQTSGELNNAYNSGIVQVGINDSGLDVAGGISGLQTVGTISKTYNKGTLLSTDVIGGIIGQKQLAGIVEKSYYYTQGSENGIGSETDDNTKVVETSDIAEIVEKVTENIVDYNMFVEWIAKK